MKPAFYTMDDNIDIKILEKYLEGTASPEEEQIVEIWLAAREGRAPLFEEEESEAALQYKATAKTAVMNKLHPAGAVNSSYRKRRILFLRIAAAASVLSVIVVTASWLRGDITKKHIRKQVASKETVSPLSRNKATLVLSGDRAVTLESLSSGQTLREGFVTIVKTAGNEIQYMPVETTEQQPAVINKLSVPNSSQYIVVLPDGSKVWLNAGSTISFPAVFSGKTRDVAVTGEAYFEVAQKVNEPFRVTTKKMTVLVLGTHFNINAYEDEPVTHTTLLEGSVQVEVNKQKIQIRPGDQAQLNNAGSLSVTQPNITEVVAWQKGYLQFDNTPLEEVFRQIGRWYDVEVVFKGIARQGSFHGKIYPGMKLPEILRSLEVNGALFTFDGTKIIVK